MGHESLLLYILSILITILVALVGAIYYNIQKNQDITDKRVETHRIETAKALEKATASHDDLRDHFNEEINDLKEKYHGIDRTHIQWCQKHEDHMNATDQKLNTFESKIKGQGDFFNQRVEEFKIIVRQIEKLIKTKQT